MTESAPCRSSARLAWRTAVSWRPVSFGRRGRLEQASMACVVMLGLTLSTAPSSARSSAAVAAWWARSSMLAPRSARMAATPAWRCARTRLVSVW